MILIPIICSASVPIYFYLSAPERVLISGYKEIKKLENLKIENRDLDILRAELRTIPPGVQTAVIAEHSAVLMSSIPGIKQGTTINDDEIFSFLRKTSRNYFYQVVTPKLSSDTNVLIISRMPRDEKHKNTRFSSLVLYTSLFLGIFEAFCIVAVLSISRTILRSISILEKDTDRIASGDLDFDLEAEAAVKHHVSNEITSLTKNLNKMRLALKDETERRNRFIMGISHDLRTPVAVIKGYTEAISEGFCTTPEETKKSLKIISAKTEQLETMINTLINFVKLNQTDWMQQLKKQKIAPVLEEFAQSSVTTGGLFKRNVSKNIQIDENIEVPFDSELIQRALENLFSNALRYTNENDAIEIIAYQEKLDGNNERILVKIKDYGIGIKKEDLEKIFDMFYRSSSSRREEGMGIGLATVMTIVKAHGWKISVDSELNKGSEFIIEIPVK